MKNVGRWLRRAASAVGGCYQGTGDATAEALAAYCEATERLATPAELASAR